MAGEGRGRRYSDNKCSLYFAGACVPNPGEASIGYVIFDEDDRRLATFASVIDPFPLTSNAAHYRALIAGLRHALDLGITDIVAYGHLELIPEQVNLRSNCESKMSRYRRKVRKIGYSMFETFEVVYIQREFNSVARSLAQACFC